MPKQQIRIKSARVDEEAIGGYVYEIEPINYTGPRKLEPNTVLEVVGRLGDQEEEE